MTRVAVMGSGNWGTAFAAILADAGCTVRLWARRPEVAAAVNAGCNDAYLPELDLPETVRATTSAQEALDGCDIAVLAVPAQTLRDTTSPTGARPCRRGAGRLAHEGRRARHDPADERGHRAGRPRRARPRRRALRPQPRGRESRASSRRPASSPAATWRRPSGSRTPAPRRTSGRTTDTDVIGAEVCGATKNVVALASGMAEGLGFGDNTKATIITRGLAETTRLGLAPGRAPADLHGPRGCR